MKKVYEWIGGRKLTFAIILMIVSAVFVWVDKCTAQEWINFMTWVFGTYALGNGMEHVAKGIKK